jgi:hypothetical protein
MRNIDLEFTPTRVSSKSFREKPRREKHETTRHEAIKSRQRDIAKQKRS